MDDRSLPGALSGPPPTPISSAGFDQAHSVTARSELVWRLAAQAYGEDYPAEVQPWGMTTFWVLGRCVSGLRVGPGHLLVDLACGRGGPGLWLARATGASLIGVDWSPVGVEAASARASHFVPADRARFIVGDLAVSGLPDESADAVVCLDSIFFAADRIAALREVHRLLRPAGRYVFTAPEVRTPTQPFHVPDWTPLLEAAGLLVTLADLSTLGSSNLVENALPAAPLLTPSPTRAAIQTTTTTTRWRGWSKRVRGSAEGRG